MTEMYNRYGLEHVVELVDVDSKVKTSKSLIWGKPREMQVRLNRMRTNEINRYRRQTVVGSQRPRTFPFRFNGNGDSMAWNPIEAVERERNNLSRELHDGLLSSLIAIKLKLEIALLEKADFRGSITEAIGHIENTIKETRNLSENLRFSKLDQIDLHSKIGRFCKMIEDCHKGLKIETEIDIPEEKIPRTYKVVIYRILQEAVSNSVKHGDADRIGFGLGRREGKIVFFVADNGDGFELEGIPKRNDALHGNGLTNMRERAETVGGTFEILSRIGIGTRIMVSLPEKTDF